MIIQRLNLIIFLAVCICFKQRESKNENFLVPWKWISDTVEDLFFVKKSKNSNMWAAYSPSCDRKFCGYYRELETSVDANGDLEVLLKSIEKNETFKLSQGMSCLYGTNNSCEKNLTEGFWVKNEEVCKKLPINCEIINYRKIPKRYIYETSKIGLLCENDFDEEKLKLFASFMNGCPYLKFSEINIQIKPLSEPNILNQNSTVIFKISELTNLKYNPSLAFLHFRGFDIDTFVRFDNIGSIEFYTDFNLYRKTELVKSCQDFGGSTSRSFIFGNINQASEFNLLEIGIIKPKMKYAICPLFFRNAKLYGLTVSYMANSFVLNNMMSFSDLDNVSISDFDSRIDGFYVMNSYGLNLDPKLVNSVIFKNTSILGIDHISTINGNVFDSLSNLRDVYFDPLNLIELIRKQGIEWIKHINSNVSVDVTNITLLNQNVENLVLIGFYPIRKFVIDQTKHLAYDRDFCLFVDYPFHQMVLFGAPDELDFKRKTTFSCTELWLYRYHRFIDFNLDMYLFNDPAILLTKQRLETYNFTNCEFEKRVQKCNKTLMLSKNDQFSKFANISFFGSMTVSELGLIVLATLLACYALFSNLLTIYVIHHKKSVDINGEKHFVYMQLHCWSNSFISVIQILNLVSECQLPLGLFCSSIRNRVAVQYFKIIFGEYFNSAFRLVSNFTYIGFSLCRMFKLGNDHGQLVVFMNKLSIAKYMGVCAFLSLSFSICKALQYKINLDSPEYSSPLPFIQISTLFWFNNSGYVAITVINAVYDLIAYFLFILANVCVDVALIKKLSRVLKEKEDKMKEFNLLGVAKVKKENKESKRRTLSMVVFNSLFNLTTKVPLMITSLNDVRIVSKKLATNFDFSWTKFDDSSIMFSLGYYCLSQKSCVIFQRFGNCLYLFSLCSILHFLKRFDKNFLLAYKQIFKDKKLSSLQ